MAVISSCSKIFEHALHDYTFILRLFNEAASTKKVIPHPMRCKCEEARTWKGQVIACFKVLLWHSPGECLHIELISITLICHIRL